MYHAQDPVYTNSSVAAMEQTLAEFHLRKQCIIDIGAQRGTKTTINHFNIPKLELMASFARQTKANGTLIQYTVDISEHLLITHCKMTFCCTSQSVRTFTDQVVDILNCEETIWLFDLYLILQMVDSSAVDTVIHVEHRAVVTIDPQLEFIQHFMPEKVSMFCGPHRFCNHFQDPNCFTLMDGDIALHVMIQPDHNMISVAHMQVLYRLPDLPIVISHYIQEFSQGQVLTRHNFESMESGQ